MTVKIDMDMPKSCAACPLSIDMGDKSEPYEVCAITMAYVGYVFSERHYDCPLKEMK